MIISHKGNKVDVTETEEYVTVYKMGKRKKYIEKETKQCYVNALSKWYKFPQEVEY